ncbi:hypothetical protein ACFV1L_10580 [Kitasatospora sp. NPDC059646]|uniref:hypothetical protein n=1 Tax=Kitasatospora sp. NPDC059646 TaxID=3346893 RepID=UPI0036A16C94
MRIHRTAHKSRFTVLGNDLLRRHELSYCARGLLAYLLSLPDASREDVRTLAAKSVEGRTRIAAALHELEAAGHYVRRTDRDPITGQVRTRVDVYEVPQTGKSRHTQPPLPASPAAGGPGPGRPGVGKAGAPSLTVRTPAKDVMKDRPSVPPVVTKADDEEGLLAESDAIDLAEAQAAFSALLGGPDGDSPAQTPARPSEPAQSLPEAAPRPTRTSEGVGLLLELGQQRPELALSGKPLTDQGAMVEGLLAAGWPREVLLSSLSAPLPAKIFKTVAAVLAGRIAAFPVNPPADLQTAEPKKPATPRVERFECDDCRAPGQTYIGLCPKCRGVAPQPARTGVVVPGGWRTMLAETP